MMYMHYFRKEYNLPRDLIAGTIACAISSSIAAPLERLKYHLQLKGRKKKGIVTAFNSVVKTGGVRGLWAGNGANLLRLIPQMAIRMVLFRSILQEGAENSLSFFLRGTVAGFASHVIVYPMDVLRVRMTVAPAGRFRGILHAARDMYKTGGVPVFYRGFLLSSAVSAPYFGTKFGLVDAISRAFREEIVAEYQKTFNILTVGVSSTAAMLLVYPGFLIRTILQTSPALKAMSVLLYTLKKRGVRGLYSGMGVSIIRVFQVAGLNYIVYVEARDYLQKFWD